MKLIGDKLKASLLQDAFQGKLTKQLPEDGDARDLLKEIKAEKERLVKEKKIKEEKPLPVIKDEEIPFDIPKNWVWTRLGNITYNRGQKKPEKTFSYIDISSIDNTKQKLKKVLSIFEANESPIRARKIVKKGDVIYSTVRPYLLNTCIIDREIYPEPIASTGLAILCTINPILCHYVFYILISPFFNIFVNDNKNSKGVAYPAISETNLNSGLVPLPPLAEQRRIVDKLKTAIEKIDELKFFETKLSELEKSFPNKLKASLLQDAFQGKLTKQLPEDGDARDLLKEIQAEKERLVKEKKIKEEKPLPVIKDEEIPFDIPKNWVWARLGKIGYWSSGKTPNRTNFDYYNDGTYNWLKTGDLTDGNITSTSEKITEKALRETSVKLLPRGSVLIAMYGATIGKLGILEVESTTNQACCGCIPYNGILNYYLFYFLLFSRKKFIEMGAGCAQPNISKEKIINTIIPVPPLAEQRRIVDKLKTALEKIDSLNES